MPPTQPLSLDEFHARKVLRTLKRWDEASNADAEVVRLQPDLAVAHANLGPDTPAAGQARRCPTA